MGLLVSLLERQRLLAKPEANGHVPPAASSEELHAVVTLQRLAFRDNDFDYRQSTGFSIDGGHVHRNGVEPHPVQPGNSFVERLLQIPPIFRLQVGEFRRFRVVEQEVERPVLIAKNVKLHSRLEGCDRGKLFIQRNAPGPDVIRPLESLRHLNQRLQNRPIRIGMARASDQDPGRIVSPVAQDAQK